MRAGLLTVTLYLPGVHSLKEKRSILKPLINHVARLGPAIGIAEVGLHDDLTRAMVRIVHLSTDPRRTESVLEKVRANLGEGRRFVIEDSDLELL